MKRFSMILFIWAAGCELLGEMPQRLTDGFEEVLSILRVSDLQTRYVYGRKEGPYLE
jgi:hypothetical protein